MTSIKKTKRAYREFGAALFEELKTRGGGVSMDVSDNVIEGNVDDVAYYATLDLAGGTLDVTLEDPTAATVSMEAGDYAGAASLLARDIVPDVVAEPEPTEQV